QEEGGARVRGAQEVQDARRAAFDHRVGGRHALRIADELRVEPILDVEREGGGVSWHRWRGLDGVRGAPGSMGVAGSSNPRTPARAARWRRRGATRYALRPVRTRTLPPLVVAGLTFAYLLAYPLAIGRADESHFLYAAKRVLDGQVLYRDLFESLTP